MRFSPLEMVDVSRCSHQLSAFLIKTQNLMTVTSALSPHSRQAIRFPPRPRPGLKRGNSEYKAAADRPVAGSGSQLARCATHGGGGRTGEGGSEEDGLPDFSSRTCKVVRRYLSCRQQHTYSQLPRALYSLGYLWYVRRACAGCSTAITRGAPRGSGPSTSISIHQHPPLLHHRSHLLRLLQQTRATFRAATASLHAPQPPRPSTNVCVWMCASRPALARGEGVNPNA